MRTVENLTELKANIKTLDKYLSSKTDPKYTFGLDLTKRGTCFIAVKTKDVYRFYPSRFMGYANNSFDAHLDNAERDGRETNQAISRILGKKPLYDPSLDRSYHEYCDSLGFIANDKGAFGVERKFWEV